MGDEKEFAVRSRFENGARGPQRPKPVSLAARFGGTTLSRALPG